MMSYIKDIVEKILPVEIGEEFNIILDNGDYSMHNPVKFSETDLVNNDGDILNGYISTLITGEYKIEKIPKFPPKGTRYYFVNEKGCILNYEFNREWSFDLYMYKLGNFFLTYEEAEQNKNKVLDFLNSPTKGDI